MATTKEATDRAVAATMPMALHQLADHITSHHLPGPADINLPGTLIGDHELPTVLVLLDERSTSAWIASLDSKAEAATVTEHAGGAWHDLNGVANCVRLRLSWWTSAPAVDHEVCRGGCGQVLCYCRGRETKPCQGTVEGACRHGEFLCDGCMSSCSGCVEDVRQERAEGWSRR